MNTSLSSSSIVVFFCCDACVELLLVLKVTIDPSLNSGPFVFFVIHVLSYFQHQK
jgi:hypothetical protein